VGRQRRAASSGVALPHLFGLAALALASNQPATPGVVRNGSYAIAKLAADAEPRRSGFGRQDLAVGLPFATFALVAIILDLVANAQVDPAFFRTAATIIPTLVLALALQGRIFRRADRWLGGSLFIYFAIAEAFALWRVASGTHKQHEAGFTAAGIAAGFVGLAILAFTESPNEARDVVEGGNSEAA